LFGRDEKSGYQDQIDFLKQTITNAINANLSLRVTKINQAGSWRKGTALFPAAGQEIDIDLVVYLDVEEAQRSHLEELHALIVGLLRRAYPTKPPTDFQPSTKTVGIEFRTSGLLVDLVPVIPVAKPPGYVWQPERGGGGSFQTSPDGQLEFIRAVKDADPRFTQVVRLAKRWRNYAELEGLSSFAIELIIAHLNRTRQPSSSINAGFMRFLLYLVQSELREVITFPGAIRRVPSNATPVRIHDPTNNENNVTARMTEEERVAAVRAAHDSLQAVNHAMSVGRKGDTAAHWQAVLGPQFFM
jgi:hypothetical protein